LNRKIEGELPAAIIAYGVGLLPYYPLAAGLLSGKYRRGAAPAPEDRLAMGYFAAQWLNDENLAIVESLQAFAAARGKSLLELAFGWLATQPFVASVIAGASRPEQVEANVAAAQWRLSEVELAEVDTLLNRA
jgi:aryl-alcohol dehydrogenase-like predicted oxidoreductase